MYTGLSPKGSMGIYIASTNNVTVLRWVYTCNWWPKDAVSSPHLKARFSIFLLVPYSVSKAELQARCSHSVLLHWNGHFLSKKIAQAKMGLVYMYTYIMQKYWWCRTGKRVPYRKLLSCTISQKVTHYLMESTLVGEDVLFHGVNPVQICDSNPAYSFMRSKPNCA